MAAAILGRWAQTDGVRPSLFRNIADMVRGGSTSGSIQLAALGRAVNTRKLTVQKPVLTSSPSGESLSQKRGGMAS